VIQRLACDLTMAGERQWEGGVGKGAGGWYVGVRRSV
jgi:hypothetical protein